MRATAPASKRSRPHSASFRRKLPQPRSNGWSSKSCVKTSPAAERLASLRGLAPMNVFHVAERNAGIMFAGIFEVEGVACQEHHIAIEILGDARVVVDHELVEQLTVGRRDPARKRKLRRVPANFKSIFGSEPGLEHVELQRTHNANERRRTI